MQIRVEKKLYLNAKYSFSQNCNNRAKFLQNISMVSGKEGISLPVGANEAAIVVDVQPGVSYAAIVTEQDTTIGDNEVREAIVEAYEITE